MKDKFGKFLIVGCMFTAVAVFTGCQLNSLLTNDSNKVQTKENGEERQTYAQSKTEGYDVSYSGTISGYSKNIKVSMDNGAYTISGSGAFNWVTDDTVEIVFDAKKGKKSKTIIVSEENVVISMDTKVSNEKIGEADKKKTTNNDTKEINNKK